MAAASVSRAASAAQTQESMPPLRRTIDFALFAIDRSFIISLRGRRQESSRHGHPIPIAFLD
jgi:hypothetical protein